MSSKILPFFNKKTCTEKNQVMLAGLLRVSGNLSAYNTQKNFGIITLMIETACGTDFRDGHFGCV